MRSFRGIRGLVARRRVVARRFLLIWTADILDSLRESDVYDNDNDTKTVEPAPEFV